MRAGDPTAQTCVDWEHACRRYANNKVIPADKLVKRMLDGIEDVRFIDWIELDRPHFEAMTLVAEPLSPACIFVAFHHSFDMSI